MCYRSAKSCKGVKLDVQYPGIDDLVAQGIGRQGERRVIDAMSSPTPSREQA